MPSESVKKVLDAEEQAGQALRAAQERAQQVRTKAADYAQKKKAQERAEEEKVLLTLQAQTEETVRQIEEDAVRLQQAQVQRIQNTAQERQAAAVQAVLDFIYGR